MKNKKLKKWIEVRQQLHKLAELSGKETRTSACVISLLEQYKPDELITGLAETGVAAVYNGALPGKTLMLRCELDALPIEETLDISYKSKTSGVSHKCGHDGHMAILLSLAEWLNEHKEELSGRVILLFQPAEETAGGARVLLSDPEFEKLNPDYIYGFHNLPGFDKGKLILRKGVFAAASTGIKIFFTGKTSHAGHPENGLNPLYAMQNVVNALQVLPERTAGIKEKAMITIIHLNLGEEAFGTSPGKGVIMATLRAENNVLLAKMYYESKKIARTEANLYGLTCYVQKVEEFAATINDDEALRYLQKLGKFPEIEIFWQPEMFTWTEDFSFYGQKYCTAFFGLGSGKDQPQLHNPEYDFPDDLIKSGRIIFIELIREVLNAG